MKAKAHKEYLTSTGTPCGLKKFGKSYSLEVEAYEIEEYLNLRWNNKITNMKLLNPLRELDKTSVWIFNNCKTEEDFYKARFINRIDVLEKGYPISSPFTNTQAYQISPSALRMRGYNNIEPLFKIDIPNKMEEVLSVASQGYKKMNEAFGGGVPFVMYQIYLDLAWVFPDKYDRNAEPYYGTGSKHLIVNGDIKWDNCPREYYQSDIENWLCEFRKYKTWTDNGIPFNRKRNKEQDGTTI